MAVPPLADTKRQLRTAMRARRASFRATLAAEDGLAAAQAAIRRRLLAEAAGHALIALHLPFGDEPPFDGLAELLAADGRRLALPVLDDDGGMRFAAWMPGNPLRPGRSGIRQPLGDAVSVEPDLIVVPLVAFDRGGGRLGQGGGHYDRSCSGLPLARRLGCAWSSQEVATVPCDPWDMPLHTVVTEREHIPCGNGP